jgi:hypothetical protein
MHRIFPLEALSGVSRLEPASAGALPTFCQIGPQSLAVASWSLFAAAGVLIKFFIRQDR